MAAVLKKRALAEYSQTIQEGPSYETKVKKLRLVKKIQPGNTTLALISCLESSKNSGDALRTLLRISDAFELEAVDIPEAVQKLSDHFKIEAESAVRVKILSILADLGLEPNTGHLTMSIIEEIVSLIRNDKSHKVLAQGMDSCLRLGKSTSSEETRNRLVAIARSYIRDTNQRVRCKCLEMVGEYAAVTSASEVNGEPSEVLRLVSAHFGDSDARVRSQSLRTMGAWAKRGAKLPSSLYEPVGEALKDDNEIVRQMALKLLAELAQSYPETVILLPNNDTDDDNLHVDQRDREQQEEYLRLVDDAFAKVCGLVTDLSPRVRALACSILGGMISVGAQFLTQTLDKKLMSNMRRKRTAHELAWESVTSGEWASGRRWAEDKPRELLDKDSVSLIGSGACGAFVHGLEDEFLEVRSAAVQSICRLSQQNSDFANLALDYLVDMLNDEIEDVRLKAIDSLRLISAHIVLRDDQVETILGALEDFAQEVRFGLHGMLAACRMATTAGVKLTIDRLLDNLRRYPGDKRSTYRCLQRVGARHPELVLPLVPLLLAVHPYLDTTEPDVDNPLYVCQLVVVLNAARYSVGVAPLLEEAHRRHYRYLRDTMPYLVPKLEHLDGNGSGVSGVLAQPPDSMRALETIVSSLETGHGGMEPGSTQLQTAQGQLQRLGAMDVTIAGAAQFASRYIGARLVLSRLISQLTGSGSRSSTGGGCLQVLGNTTRRIDSLLTECDSLMYTFVGHTEAERCDLLMFRFRALAVNLLHQLRENVSTDASAHFLRTSVNLHRHLVSTGIEPDAFTTSILREINGLEKADSSVIITTLSTLLCESPMPKIPHPNKNMQVSTAEIIEPTGRTDSSLKFTAGLVMAIPFEAELRHLHDPSRLRLQVRYPDQQVQVVVPRVDDLRPIDADTEMEGCQPLRLLTTVLVSHQVWSEPCNVELGVAVIVPEQRLVDSLPDVTGRSAGGLIPLCKPVKISLSPKPIKPLCISK